MISPSRLQDDSWDFYDISSTILPEIYRQSFVRCPVFFLVRLLFRPLRYRVAPAAGESFGPHPMLAMPSHVHPYPHGPPPNCNTPSTSKLHVFSFQVGRLVLLNKDYRSNTSYPSKIFRQGGNAWNLFDFDEQSAAIFCVDTVKCYSIPSVPNR